MYENGRGAPLDFVEADRWCRKAADDGYAQAQAKIGYLYFRGERVPQDFAQAANWYRKSADQGDSNAQYALGYMYYNGFGVAQDKGEAGRLFRQAAAHGNPDARRILGWNRMHLSATNWFALVLEFLASLTFGIPFLSSGQSPRTLPQKVLGVAAVLLITAFALDVSWYFYARYLQSSATVTLLYLARHLVRGAVIGVLIFILHRKSARAVLIAAAIIFVGFVGFAAALAEMRHIPLTVSFLCFAGGPIGMAILSAIFLWLDRKGSLVRESDKGPLAASM
jgi:hypothetical protein